MQTSTTSRRIDPWQIKQVALAIAIVTSAAIGVTTAAIVHDAGEADSSRTIVTSAATNRELAFGYQFLEQNLDLPVGIAAPAVNTYADYWFMEQNLILPGGDIAPATHSPRIQ